MWMYVMSVCVLLFGELPSSVCFLNSGAAVGKMSCVSTMAKVSSKSTLMRPIFLFDTSSGYLELLGFTF